MARKFLRRKHFTSETRPLYLLVMASFNEKTKSTCFCKCFFWLRRKEQDLGYEVSIMTGEATLRREQGLRGSIDILKYKAQKLAEEYATLKEKFQGSGLKLSAEMAQYIVCTGQKEQFAEYQRNNARQQGEERS